MWWWICYQLFEYNRLWRHGYYCDKNTLIFAKHEIKLELKYPHENNKIFSQ